MWGISSQAARASVTGVTTQVLTHEGGALSDGSLMIIIGPPSSVSNSIGIVSFTHDSE
jgi:hypothetical protein